VVERKTFFGLVERVSKSQKPVTITSKRGNVVLVSEEDWHSIQETLYLKSIPGVWESIEASMNFPGKELCLDKIF
jgi:prevent-host-death family protein